MCAIQDHVAGLTSSACVCRSNEELLMEIISEDFSTPVLSPGDGLLQLRWLVLMCATPGEVTSSSGARLRPGVLYREWFHVKPRRAHP
jgi:hypothetical protein